MSSTTRKNLSRKRDIPRPSSVELLDAEASQGVRVYWRRNLGAVVATILTMLFFLSVAGWTIYTLLQFETFDSTTISAGVYTLALVLIALVSSYWCLAVWINHTDITVIRIDENHTLAVANGPLPWRKSKSFRMPITQIESVYCVEAKSTNSYGTISYSYEFRVRTYQKEHVLVPVELRTVAEGLYIQKHFGSILARARSDVPKSAGI